MGQLSDVGEQLWVGIAGYWRTVAQSSRNDKAQTKPNRSTQKTQIGEGGRTGTQIETGGGKQSADPGSTPQNSEKQKEATKEKETQEQSTGKIEQTTGLQFTKTKATTAMGEQNYQGRRVECKKVRGATHLYRPLHENELHLSNVHEQMLGLCSSIGPSFSRKRG